MFYVTFKFMLQIWDNTMTIVKRLQCFNLCLSVKRKFGSFGCFLNRENVQMSYIMWFPVGNPVTASCFFSTCFHIRISYDDPYQLQLSRIAVIHHVTYGFTHQPSAWFI